MHDTGGGKAVVTRAPKTKLDGLTILSPLTDLSVEDEAWLTPPADWWQDIRFGAASKTTEGGEQALLFEMRARYQARHSVLRTLHHIPNGGYHPVKVNPRTGRYYSMEAQRLQRLGLTPGIPDVCLPFQAYGFGSLYLEFKKPYEDLEPHQVEMCEELVLQGNLVARVHRGLLAWRLVVRYAGLPESLLGGY